MAMNPHINQLLTPKINQEEIHQPVNPQNLIETPVQNINSDIPKDFQNSQNPYNESIFSDASSSKSKSPSIVRSSSHSDNGRDSRTPSKKSRSPSRSRSRSRSPSNKSYHSRDFIMKNGCCKECMRAFSKTGKSCLCQVPKNERKYILPEKGCNYCGCHGCNPVDVRRDKRSDLKKQLKNDKNIQYKNQRLLESEDEELKINVKEVDDWNNKKRELLNYLKNELKTNPYFMGFGVPMRTPGYILGYIPNKEGNGSKRRGRGQMSNTYSRRKEDDSH